MARNRIREFRTIAASELVPNPRNWRLHPKHQRDALAAMLEEVGSVDVLKVVETDAGLMLIDGHLRADLQRDEQVQVAVLDLDEDEQAKVLATFDPLSAMAQRGLEAYLKLAESVKTKSAAVMGLLEAVANDNYVSLMPLVESHDRSDFSDREGKEFFAIIVYAQSEEQQLNLLERLTQEGLQCRALIS